MKLSDLFQRFFSWGEPESAPAEFATLRTMVDSSTITLLVSSLDSSLNTGDGQAMWPVSKNLDGAILSDIVAHVATASSSGTPTVQIRNATRSVDMLSTRATIDANEKSSLTAATAAVINPSTCTVSSGDQLFVDVDVAGTSTAGLVIELIFRAQ